MVRVEITHTFPVGVNRAFAYITDIQRWPEYWPGFVRLLDPVNARWARRGDAVAIVLKLLGRERELRMTLEEFREGQLVTYVSRQDGLPDVRHERHFKVAPGGFEYRLVVVYQPRPGLAGVFDRLVLKRAVAGALRRTITNLGRVLHGRDQETKEGDRWTFR